MRKLFSKYIDNQCSEGELRQLLHFFGASSNEENVREVIHETLVTDNLDPEKNLQAIAGDVYNKILTRIQSQPARKKNFIYTRWYRIAAAAVVLVALFWGGYLLLNKSAGHILPVTVSANTDVKAPDANIARIILSDGTQVYIDSVNNGEVALQSNVKVIKLANGEIAYRTINGKPIEELQYNTLYNPRGSRPINLMLSDGSKVWLNSESSLKYPVAFTGHDRLVEISGEAYFEVVKDLKKKFIVNISGKTRVEVLGTRFNINSYDDEETVNTTLLEGSVKVISDRNGAGKVLFPGQQVKIDKNAIITLNPNPDLEEVMAWKNGKFIFGESMDMASAMRQICRWYDIEAEFKGRITGHIGGAIQRDVNVSQVFKMIEITGAVKFELRGRKVTVHPVK